MENNFDKTKKVNVILDTDAYNECDDQFAVSYLIQSQDVLNIEAITIAPFSHQSHGTSVAEGQELSFNEVLKICNWLNFDATNKVFKGAMDYLQNGDSSSTPASDKIIETALKNDKTYLLCIGAITNVAIALKKKPEIASRIEVVWLGGNEYGYENNLEYNFRQDIAAVKTLFASKVKMTILPCKEVISKLKIHVNELRKNLSEKSELCQYLIKRFCNDGYHGVKEERVIWDISVVAFVINKTWFNIKSYNCPEISEDTSYIPTENPHQINFVTNVDRDKIYNDLFEKLGD